MGVFEDGAAIGVRKCNYVASLLGVSVAAESAFDRQLTFARRSLGTVILANSLAVKAQMRALQGDFGQAQALLAESLRLVEGVGTRSDIALWSNSAPRVG